MGQTIKAVASSVRGVKNRPEEFTELGEYVEAFAQKISVIDKVTQRIHKEEKDYYEEMKEYGPIYTLWSASEEDLVDPLRGVAGCIDKCCKVTGALSAELSSDLIPIIHEYVLYGETLSGVLRRRDLIQAELDAKVDALVNRKADKETLKEEIEKLEDKVECANNALKADWDRWTKNRRTDLKTTFLNMADSRINHYEECLATWESFLSSQSYDKQFDAQQEEDGS